MSEAKPAVGVIGTGAMGMGVVASLLRHGYSTHARDIRQEAQREATRLGAACHESAAALARNCDIVVVLVVDAGQVDEVLFGGRGLTSVAQRATTVVLSSTVAPDYTSALAMRLAVEGVTLVDAPVSGGPKRAEDGTMTMMVAGDPATLARCAPMFAAIAGRVFNVGNNVGDAAKFKIVNNLLAAVNLAAGAEAMALATRAGLDPLRVVDVINASSGASWMFADRMPRALAGDFAPRAAARILAKDVGIATEFAARLGTDAPFANAARAAFQDMVDAGYGDEDDAAMVKYLGGKSRL
ncbi:MAG: NAD(P)-dependent oxidoreductase [Betaproteobacteria bacterium]